MGGSIGGMQVLEWTVRYPDMVMSAIPLATTTKHSALAIAFNEVAGKVKIGSYPGTGSDQDITGVGFQPEYILVQNSFEIDSM